MGHTFSQNHLHVIFGTKDRRETILPRYRERLWGYINGIGANYGLVTRAAGGTGDHMHILFHLPPRLALSKAVMLLKANSSKWMSEQGIEFEWQEGYGAFSVSASNLDAVVRYIQNQEAHHRKVTFENEFRAILTKHGIAYDRADLPG